MLVPAPEIIVKKNTVFDEFQSSFGKITTATTTSSGLLHLADGGDSGPGVDDDDDGALSLPVQLRFSAGPAAERLCSGAGESGFLSVVVRGMALALPVSAATALADLFEDEVFPPPFPMNVKVEKLAFKVSLYVNGSF